MRLRREAVETPDGLPVELTVPDAAVWHDRDAYLAYMDEHGWRLPTGERFTDEGGVPFGSGPVHRRRAAVEGWAHDVGIESADHPGFLDWHRLAGMGLM